MTETDTGETETAPEPELDDEVELFLTDHARFAITVGTQFTYRGNSHWPKIEISDGPLMVVAENGDTQYEDGEYLIYRVTEIAHRTLAATIARMKHEIDERYESDQAARTGAPTTS
jgi:hypothetical protein